MVQVDHWAFWKGSRLGNNNNNSQHVDGWNQMKVEEERHRLVGRISEVRYFQMGLD